MAQHSTHVGHADAVGSAWGCCRLALTSACRGASAEVVAVSTVDCAGSIDLYRQSIYASESKEGKEMPISWTRTELRNHNETVHQTTFSVVIVQQQACIRGLCRQVCKECLASM